MLNEKNSRNESKLSSKNISEAIFYLIEFKNLIKNIKNGSFKAYLVKKDFFKILSEKLEIDFDNYDLTNKDKYFFSEKLCDLNFLEIKIFCNLDCFEDDFEIINDKVIKKLTEFKNYYNKDMIFNKISETQQEIIFKDLSKIKISIKNKQKKIYIFDSPIYKGIKDKNSEKKVDKKYYDESSNSFNLLNNNKIKRNNSLQRSSSQYQIEFIKNGNYVYNKGANDEKIKNQNNDNSAYIKNYSKIKNNNSFSVMTPENSIELIKDLYKKIKEISLGVKIIRKIIKEAINLDDELTNYLIINKKWFNKLLKIFEDDDLYQNDNIIIDSFRKIKTIDQCNDETLGNIYKLYIKRKKDLENENLFRLEFEKENKTSIFYPKDFILIEEKQLIDLNIKINYNINKNKYKILFGEKCIFLKSKINNRVIVFICLKEKIYFSVNMILNYEKEEFFNNDIKQCIQNKGGLDYFIQDRDFDLSINNEAQKNVNKKCEFLGEVVILKYNKENKEEELIDDDLECDLKTDFISNHKIEKNVNPYLRAIFLSFIRIEPLYNYLRKNPDIKNEGISGLLCKFLNEYENNNPYSIEIINKVEKIIKKEDSNYSNCFDTLIEFILWKSHEELNINKNSKKEIFLEKFDEDNAYKNFKKYFNDNDSKIQNIFFGIKEIIAKSECCKLRNYNFEIYKYIYISNEEIKKENNLNALLKKWEKNDQTKDILCKMCNKKLAAHLEGKIRDYPEVLIIILDNISKNKIDFKTQINLGIYEYYLISCITSDKENKNKFNILLRNGKEWKIYNEQNILENAGNEIRALINYPNVLYFNKEKEIFHNTRSLIDNESNGNNEYINSILNYSQNDNNISFDDKKKALDEMIENNKLISYNENKLSNGQKFNINKSNGNNSITNNNNSKKIKKEIIKETLQNSN